MMEVRRSQTLTASEEAGTEAITTGWWQTGHHSEDGSYTRAALKTKHRTCWDTGRWGPEDLAGT